MIYVNLMSAADPSDRPKVICLTNAQPLGKPRPQKAPCYGSSVAICRSSESIANSLASERPENFAIGALVRRLAA